jgi:GTP-binding protein Era
VARTRPHRTAEPRASRAGNVAICGQPNVGKSTLLNALVGERLAIVSPKAQTTRDRILGVLTKGPVQIAFVDTPGVHPPRTRLGTRMNEEARAAVSGADVVLLVVDARRGVGEADQRLLAWVPAKVPVVLVLSKIDLVPNKTDLIPRLEAAAKVRDFAALVPVSAKRHDGTERILGELERLLPESPHLYDAETLTDRPARFFVAELVREQILRQLSEEVPHGVAVVVDRFEEPEPPRVATRIACTIHVTKAAHKPIVVGAKGAMLKSIGQSARKAMEAMLGTPVHLELWVRVTERWQDRDAGLREVGYDPATRSGEGS